MSLLVARRGALYTPAAGASITPPQFIGATENAAFQGSDQPTTVAAPAGLAAGDRQFVAVYCVSSTPTFPATPPDGWAQILDQAFEYPDTAATSTGRLGLFESTSATTLFSVQMSGNRVWNAIRLAWRGASRPAAPLFAFTPQDTAHATPAIDVAQGNSVVVTIGASELANAGVDWAWTDLGAATPHIISPANNSIESATLAGGSIAVATPTSGVSATFTLPNSQRAAMVSLVLNGAPA